MTTTAVPTWFGPEDESLFGCVHLPADGRIRGAVVLCPPLAQEVTRTQAALRALAVSLAGRGVLALRFDYLGTGDSAVDSGRPGALQRWLDSIVTAQEFLAGHGVEHTGLLGLRTGGLLAANALHRLPGVRALGLWAPVVSGRRFIRQEQALYSVAVHPADRAGGDGVVEGVGITFDAELQAGLRRLKLSPPAPGGAGRVAVFDTATAVTALAADPAFAGSDVEWVTVPETYADGPSDVSFFAGRVPRTAVRLITAWVDTCLPATVQADPVTIEPRTVTTMATGHGTVRETLVSIPRDPQPGRVHAVVTEPVADTDADAAAVTARPAALLLNISVTGRTGPTRGWVTTARRVAAGGTTTVRFDRYGLGESIDDAAGYVARDFTPDAVHDVGVVARFVRPDNPSDVKLAGLCSGAWAAATAARDLRPRELVLMNMNLLAWTPAPLSEEQSRTAGVAWVLEPDPARPPTRAADYRRRFREGWRRMPLGLASALGLVNLPGPVLDALPTGTTRVTLMLCDADFDEFVHLDGLDALQRRSQDAAIELVTVYYADHGLIGRRGRERMLDELVTCLSRV